MLVFRDEHRRRILFVVKPSEISDDELFSGLCVSCLFVSLKRLQEQSEPRMRRRGRKGRRGEEEEEKWREVKKVTEEEDGADFPWTP